MRGKQILYSALSVAAFLSVILNSSYAITPPIFPQIDERPCGDLQTNPIPDRPEINFSEVLSVVDRNNDGRITDTDINETITIAASRRRSDQFVGVDLSAHELAVLTAPLTIKSGVFLFSNYSNSQRLTRLSQNPNSFASSRRTISPLIEFEEGAKLVGLSGFHIRSGYSRVSSIVQVSKRVQGVRIYNNLFVDEYGEGRREESGNLDGTPAVDIQDLTRDVVVDSNTFQHVTFAVKSRLAWSRNVIISRNNVHNWRAKAFWFSGGVIDGTDHAALELSILQNSIAPPKLNGGIRQPINVSTLDETSSARKTTIQFNKVIGLGIAHIAEFDPNGIKINSGGTADMISVHNTDEFLIDSNCVYKGGEVGINASLGARRGIISNNLVVQSDLAGINIGIGQEDKPQPSNILVKNNVVIDAGRDRANEHTRANQRHHIAGIHVENASGITISENLITSTDSGTSAPPKPYFGISIRRGTRVSIPDDNRFRLPAGIIPVGNPASD